MKKIIKNIKAYKSSMLGIALLIGAYSLMKNGIVVNEYILGGIVLSGIILLVSPDTYIKMLERYLFKKKDCDKNKEE